MKKRVSVIVINYNGYALLKNCLNSILKNTYLNYEIIVVDNGSTDNSAENIKKDFSKSLKKISIIKLNKNYGPAYARNKGFLKSKGEIIAFLDNDTQVDKNWIKSALAIFKNNSLVGSIQSKLLLLDQKNKIDYVGEKLGSFGFLKSVARYGEIDNGQYDKNSKILAAKSAGMFIKRDAFIKTGKFDPDYFIFMEETDLGWRVWLAGYQNIFCPSSIVYHKFSSTKDIVNPNFNNYLVRFHGCKNYIQTLIKNLSVINLIKILPLHILLWFSLASFLLITGKFQSAINIYKGIIWNFVNIRKIIKKRIKVQNNRKVTDKYLFKEQKMLVKTNLFYYIDKFLKAQKQIVTPENNNI